MTGLAVTEKNAIEEIRQIFGKSSRDVKDLFESLGILAVMKFSDDDVLTIPFIGQIDFHLLRKNGGNIVFTPSSFLQKCIGQVMQGTDTDAEKALMKRFQQVFQSKLKK